MFEYLKNIWEGIKDFFGFFASVKKYIEFVFQVLKDGWNSIQTVYITYPFPAIIMTICITATLVFIVLRVVNRE